MSNELTLQEAALAWAQGKRVEAIHKTLFSERWTKVEPAGTECSNTYSAGVFGDCAGKYRFRLAPEPPTKKFRPWTPEEVPVGALITNKDWSGKTYARFVITGCCADEIIWMCKGGFGKATFDWLISEGFSHSTDHGKTWLPCGVEVES